MIKFNYDALTGEVVTRDDFSYEESRKAWNRAIEQYPLVIVYCQSEKDVCTAISWARVNLLPIRIRSGCHNYEGYSTGNDVVVIDVSRMSDIYIDEEKNIVKIQGGVRNRELYEALGEHGYVFPGGGCPTVGVPGFVLGGGWGYSSRLLGLGCDILIEVKIIDYEGNIIIANENYNEDLFWACRGGGGGNFGIVTEMTFNLPKKIKMATLINIDYPHIELEESINIFKMFQTEFKNLDRRVNLKMAIYNSQDKGTGIKFTGLFYGNEEEANNILKPFKNIISKVDVKLEYITVLEANRSIQDSHPDYEKYKSTGRFVDKDYTISEIENLIKLVKNRPEGAVYVSISLYGLGGAIQDKDKYSTAFYYRGSKFIMGLQSVWEKSQYAQVNREWVKEAFNYIKIVTKGSFINFPFAELQGYEKEYYGENIKKLREVKGKYDPCDVFNFPQGIKCFPEK
ncbi:FAD-binding oxidoreductase [Clostridium gasigenes]|uniref:FAD-dependent oxidoreductase n=1 Tax=Clostridium gasigenes TaxID=94869 RepID=UPI0014385367|nr:FAD-dependent oxidoreductase [Clostridium gasigenes]NKF06866.1 FAD-binding oxidoreductase [Clostridium gasigenes]QSW19865.1 FAD-binding oxidoreductase [Clostridium gasigenes]